MLIIGLICALAAALLAKVLAVDEVCQLFPYTGPPISTASYGDFFFYINTTGNQLISYIEVRDFAGTIADFSSLYFGLNTPSGIGSLDLKPTSSCSAEGAYNLNFADNSTNSLLNAGPCIPSVDGLTVNPESNPTLSEYVNTTIGQNFKFEFIPSSAGTMNSVSLYLCYIVYPTISITSPTNGTSVTVGTDIDVQLQVESVSDPLVNVTLVCNSEVVSWNTGLASTTIAISTDYAGALGSCLLDVAVPTGYTAGDPVALTLVRQLVLVSPTQRSFTGGQSLLVNVSAPFSQDQPRINFVVTCGSTALPYSVNISVESSVTLPSSLSGFGCTFTTTNIPENYLPIPSTSVFIGMSQQQISVIAQQMNFAGFAANMPAFGPGNDAPQLKRFKKPLANKRKKRAKARQA